MESSFPIFAGFPDTSELALRLLLAAMLGALLGLRQKAIVPGVETLAGVSLAAATYVAVVLMMGSSNEQFIWQFVEVGLCILPLAGFTLITLFAERRIKKVELLVGLSMSAVIGIAAGFGAAVSAILCTGLALLAVKLLQNKQS